MSTVVKTGRYEIIGEVGRGAMGIVYKAIDPVIGRTVAVKTIRLSEVGTGLSRPELLSRFQTEARAAGLLTHPNIVVVYDAGEEDGLYYITMEMVEGKSMQALLDEGQKFSLSRVLRIMDQTCSALQFAHERHVVHRDIKPANLMLTADDTVKVTDFGTAKILQFGTVQQTTHVMGTPSYMSPEQVKGRAVDGRSDIFSLGVMLYEMVTGEKPFPGQNITTVIYKIVNEDPVAPRQLDPSIHPGISAVIMKALLKEPEERYQSCREMLEDLRNYRANTSAAANPQSTVTLGSNGSPTATMALGINGRQLPGPNDAYVSATAQALSARASGPGQTPLVRRTGVITPVAEPAKKTSIWVTLLIAVLLLGVIAYGANKLQPIFRAAKDFHEASSAQKPVETSQPRSAEPVLPRRRRRLRSRHRPRLRSRPRRRPHLSVAASASTPAADSSDPAKDAAAPVTTPVATSVTPSVAPAAAPPTLSPAAPAAKDAAAPATPMPEVKSPEVLVQKANAKPAETVKADTGLSPKAAEYKERIDATLAARGLAGRASVQGVGDTLTLSGKLHPAEHGALLKFLRNAPPGVRLIDHLEDGNSAISPAQDSGAIHVAANVPAATASLLGPQGHLLKQCQTPCDFTGLAGASYSLEVKKEGYQTLQTALAVKAGESLQQKINLESLVLGIKIVSDPPGADVFIDGAKQGGQTPVVLPLAPGRYNLVLRMAGFSAYVSEIHVTDNVLSQLNATLRAKDTSKVAWADVTSTPSGAEIVIDGSTTSQFTPSRVQVPAGIHTITLKKKGFLPARRPLEVSEGGTVSVEATLRSSK